MVKVLGVSVMLKMSCSRCKTDCTESVLVKQEHLTNPDVPYNGGITEIAKKDFADQKATEGWRELVLEGILGASNVAVTRYIICPICVKELKSW